MKKIFPVVFLLTCSFSFHLYSVEIGAPVPDNPGIVYATKDGSRIRPAPGYTWEDDNKTAVKWTPGIAHYIHENVVASQEKDQWSPAPGYVWANNVDGDFSVVRKLTASSVSSGNYNPRGGQAEDGSYYGPAGSDGQPVFTGSNGTLYNAWYEWENPTPPPANAHWIDQQNYTIKRGAIEAWVVSQLYEEQMQNPRLQVPVKTIAYLESCVKAKGQHLDNLNKILDIQLQRQKEEAARQRW